MASPIDEPVRLKQHLCDVCTRGFPNAHQRDEHRKTHQQLQDEAQREGVQKKRQKELDQKKEKDAAHAKAVNLGGAKQITGFFGKIPKRARSEDTEEGGGVDRGVSKQRTSDGDHGGSHGGGSALSSARRPQSGLEQV
jgi:hypothetical protein